MAHLALHSQFTKPHVVKETVLCSAVVSGHNMSVNTLTSFLAVSIGQEVSAGGDLVFEINVKVFTVLSFFTLAFKPVDTDYFFVF